MDDGGFVNSRSLETIIRKRRWFRILSHPFLSSQTVALSPRIINSHAPRSLRKKGRKENFSSKLGKWMKWFAYQYVEIEIINSMVEQLANDFLFLSIPDGCPLPPHIDHLNGLTLPPDLSRLGSLLLRIQRKEASNVRFEDDFLQDSKNWNSSSGQKCGRFKCPISGVNSRIDLRNELPSNHFDKINCTKEKEYPMR